MSAARAVALGLLFAALVGSPSKGGLSAEPVHKTKRSTPAHPSHTAPDVTATITKPSMAPPPQGTTAHDNEIPPPFTLPAASRAKVRACGETWRDMKLAGTTGDDDWRDFALKCLVGQNSANNRPANPAPAALGR